MTTDTQTRPGHRELCCAAGTPRGGETTSHAHEKATGFPNDALVSYIQAGANRAGCSAGSG